METIASCPECGADDLGVNKCSECGYVYLLASAPVSLASWGKILAGVGVVLALYAMFIYDPSVATERAFGVPESTLPDRVNNISLMQQQLMIFFGGCTMVVAGTIMACADFIKRPVEKVSAR